MVVNFELNYYCFFFGIIYFSSLFFLLFVWMWYVWISQWVVCMCLFVCVCYWYFFVHWLKLFCTKLVVCFLSFFQSSVGSEGSFPGHYHNLWHSHLLQSIWRLGFEHPTYDASALTNCATAATKNILFIFNKFELLPFFSPFWPDTLTVIIYLSCHTKFD